MNLIKTNQFYIVLSLICAICVFPMSTLFQTMAYWGNNLIWYWVGVVLTYAIWLIGVTFIFLIFTKKSGDYNVLVASLSIVSGILLVLGFLWTTFIIIAGMSGL